MAPRSEVGDAPQESTRADMRLEDIALGSTYQIDTPFVRNCTVRVDAIDVHHMGEYQRLEHVWKTALVWVYEPPGGPRYPVSLQAFRPL